jgi:two-component system, cell cycle sensor histidine kinase and response regulator CckA
MQDKTIPASFFSSDDFIRTLIQSSPLAIMAIDPQMNVQIWNPAAEKLFLWKEEEVIGKPLPIVPEDRSNEFREYYQQVMRGEAIKEKKTQRRRKDQSLIDVSLSTSALFNKQGEVCGAMAIILDITEQRKLEEQLRQSQKIEAVGRLAGGVAHDFNNLLTAIIGYSDLALHYLDNKEQLKKKLEEVKRSANRATSMTRQLLAYSRKQMIQPKVLNLNSVLNDMQKMVRQLIGEDIDIVFSLNNDLGSIRADIGQMEQMILNLLVNSRDAMPQGGTVTVKTQNVYLDEEHARQYIDITPGNYIMLSVADSGAGMDEETQKHIFEPFFTTKPTGMGTGLGLSTVYGVVKQSGGHVTVWSKIGQGTDFTIYLPQIDSEPDPIPQPVAPSELPTGTETVLVVDDDENIRTLVSETLEECGYTVLRAQHGGEALLICQKHRGEIHLMLSDVVMPQIGGRVLAEKLVLLYPNIKMLFMSGYTDDILVRHIVLDANPLFLEKPFTMQALACKVREVLDSPSS